MNNLHINMYVREKLDTFPRKGAVEKNRFIHDLWHDALASNCIMFNCNLFEYLGQEGGGYNFHTDYVKSTHFAKCSLPNSANLKFLKNSLNHPIKQSHWHLSLCFYVCHLRYSVYLILRTKMKKVRIK